MKKRFPKIPLGWIVALGLFILGFLVYSGIPGFYFTGYILWGCGALVVCYQLLKLPGKKKPKAAKILRRILTTCLILGLTVAFVTGCFVFEGALGDPEEECDYIIVLGAGVNGTTPSLILSNRIDAAYTYLAEHPDVICVVSGGQGANEDISEAQCMYDHLTARGIDPARIWLEDKSTSTRENLQFSLDVIEEKTGSRPERLGVLSSEFHLFRAGLFANEQGVTAVGIPAETSWFSLRVNYFLREIVGVWYYLILGG